MTKEIVSFFHANKFKSISHEVSKTGLHFQSIITEVQKNIYTSINCSIQMISSGCCLQTSSKFGGHPNVHK